eukprot:NODE_205_length_14851_cov_0.317584.p10 type:complete len:121 gc:universal NODE_205_length_14851_cov_0.317584:12869-13231(+)
MNIKYLLNPENDDKASYSCTPKLKIDLFTYICESGYCPICKTAFVSKGSASRHYFCVHSAALKCPFCPRKIKYLGRMDLLKQHLIRCQQGKFITHSELKRIYLFALNQMNIKIPSCRSVR